MCGRFSLSTSPAAVADHFGLEQTPALEPRFNIAPGQRIATIAAESPEDARPQLRWCRWGLVPFWAKDARIGQRLINARAETAAEKPAFRNALRGRRCLVPADGFYEWTGSQGAKQPYFIAFADRALFAFAGLWERWSDPDGEVVDSCALLTRSADEKLRALHERMPVIVDPRDYALWIDPAVTQPERLSSALARSLGATLEAVAVSSHVNDVRRDDPRCIEPIAHAAGCG